MMDIIYPACAIIGTLALVALATAAWAGYALLAAWRAGAVREWKKP